MAGIVNGTFTDELACHQSFLAKCRDFPTSIVNHTPLLSRKGYWDMASLTSFFSIIFWQKFGVLVLIRKEIKKKVSGAGAGGWWANPLQTLSPQGLVLTLRFTLGPELDNCQISFYFVLLLPFKWTVSRIFISFTAKLTNFLACHGHGCSLLTCVWFLFHTAAKLNKVNIMFLIWLCKSMPSDHLNHRDYCCKHLTITI